MNYKIRYKYFNFDTLFFITLILLATLLCVLVTDIILYDKIQQTKLEQQLQQCNEALNEAVMDELKKVSR